MIVATLATTSLENIASHAWKNDCSPDQLWFQVNIKIPGKISIVDFKTYIFKNRHVTWRLMKRAEASNYSAIVVSLGFHGTIRSNIRSNFKLPRKLRFSCFHQLEHLL